jgi:hypothetical protein
LLLPERVTKSREVKITPKEKNIIKTRKKEGGRNSKLIPQTQHAALKNIIKKQ